MSKLLQGLTLLCAVTAVQTAAADDSIAIQADLLVMPVDLLVRDVQNPRPPDTDQYLRADEIQEKLSLLVQRKVELVEAREDSAMGVGDYIVAAIMPGGLIYAGYKQREYFLAKKDLAEVNAEIDRYVDRLDSLQAVPDSIVMAPQHLVDVDGLVHPY